MYPIGRSEVLTDLSDTAVIEKKMTSIYVLELSNDKYYVGMSEEPDQRIQKHLNGQGSAWTKKHKPTGRYRIINNDSNPYNLKETTESTVTYHLMQRFGYQNVRGSGWSTSNDLPKPPIAPHNYHPLN